MSIDLLSPLALFCIAKDPAFHVLSLHHKYAVPANNDVVDLGGAVFRGQGDVFDQVVTGFIEKEFGRKVNHRFTGFAFEPGRFDDHRQNKQRNQIPDTRGNGDLEGMQYLGVFHPLSLTAA